MTKPKSSDCLPDQKQNLVEHSSSLNNEETLIEPTQETTYLDIILLGCGHHPDSPEWMKDSILLADH